MEATRTKFIEGLKETFPEWTINATPIDRTPWNTSGIRSIITMALKRTSFEIQLTHYGNDSEIYCSLLRGHTESLDPQALFNYAVQKIQQENSFHMQMQEYEMDCLRQELAELRELVVALIYAPGGPIYKEAEKRFESRQN
nr:hypothetical protein K-LCC10_0283 [Kaumoebavirus]